MSKNKLFRHYFLVELRQQTLFDTQVLASLLHRPLRPGDQEQRAVRRPRGTLGVSQRLLPPYALH